MGHLFRALTLADELERRGFPTKLYVNDDPAVLDVIRARRCAWRVRPGESPAWDALMVREDRISTWINDRLDTTAEHCEAVVSAGARIVGLDDRGPAAALLDINVAPLPVASGVRPAGKLILSGLQYMIVNPNIERFRRVRNTPSRLVISMGGSDGFDLTAAAVRALRKRGLGGTVVLGPGFRHYDSINSEVDHRFVIKRNVPDLPTEFANHDLALTAGGVTLCEALAAGLPCIVVAAEKWEEDTARFFENARAVLYAGFRGDADFSVLDRIPPSIEQMSKAALAIVDVRGVQRVADALIAL
jgi:spore coat polysaccharide biosynthesis predicted glycosyltransferase SpsG